MALLYSQSMFDENNYEVFNKQASASVGVVKVTGDNFLALPNEGSPSNFGSLEAAIKYFEGLEGIGRGAQSGTLVNSAQTSLFA